jgi:hypothetical protein
MEMKSMCRRAVTAAAIGLAVSSAALGAQGADAVGAMKGDLRRLVSANEVYHAKNKTYAPNVAALPGFKPSGGITITFVTVTPTGWSANAQSASLPGKSCVIFIGAINPPPKTAGEKLSGPEAVAVCDKP